jgi:hypothetical protein
MEKNSHQGLDDAWHMTGLNWEFFFSSRIVFFFEKEEKGIFADISGAI